MRKFTGKAVSLVLAMALVVSSFSSTFAFAARKTVKAYDLDCNDKDVVLVKDSNSTDYSFDVMTYINKGDGAKLKYVDDREKKEEPLSSTGDDVKVTVRHSSGDSLLGFKSVGEDDKPMMRVKKNKTGSETVEIFAEVNVDLEDGTEAVVKGSKEITFNVVSTEDRFVLEENDTHTQQTKLKTSLDDDMDTPDDIEFTVDDAEPKTVGIYKAVAGDMGCVNYVRTHTDKDGNSLYIEPDHNSHVWADNSTKDHRTGFTEEVKVYDKNDVEDITAVAPELQNVVKIQNAGNKNGTLKLDIKSLDDNGKKDAQGNKIYKSDDTVDTTTVAVLKKVQVTGDVEVTKDGSQVKISKGSMAGAYKDSLSKTSLSGYAFKGTNTTDKITFNDGVSVGKVTNFDDVTVTDEAKTGDIDDISGTVTINDESSSVGKIDGIEGNVKLTEGRAESIEADGTVTIDGGTVTGFVKAGTADINATDDDVNTVIGGELKATTITIKADTDATVKIASIKLKDKDDAKITLSGENVAIKSLNADYEGDVDFDDFQGDIESLLHPDEVTVDEDTKATIKGDVDATSLDIDEDGSLEFTGALTVDTLSGDGKITVPADKLMINEDASSNLILKLSGNDVKVGDVAYKADKDASVDTDSFKGFGFDVEKKSVDKNTDSYLVKNVTFAGVALDKTAIEIAKDYSNTVTVSNYPASTSLPAGAKIVWDYSDADKDVFAVTENGNTVTIKAVGFDSKYATSNEFDLTATVVDANGDEIEDYDEATCKVTAVAEPKVSCDLSGIVEVPQGSIKNFTLSSPALVTPALGNGAVAVTGTVKAYANGQATYAVKAIGAVGTTTGVYAQVGAFKKQAFTLKVVAPKVTVDTTVNFALAKGNRYVYKVTAPAGKPTFTVGNGAVIKTQYAKVVGNNYYFIVYAVGNAGQSTGVYVNGVKVNAITVK